MSQKQQRQQKNNQKRPRDAASRLKREVERARSAKSKTSNVAPAQSAKGGEGSKRMNTLPPAATEAELKRRNYKDAKKKKEESSGALFQALYCKETMERGPARGQSVMGKR